MSPLWGWSAPDSSPAAFFESRVLPVLKQHCYKCHSHEAKKSKGGLMLDSRAGWQTGGGTGPAIVPGQPGKSLLIRAIQHTDPDLQMPPKKKLPEVDIAVLIEWVKTGAHDPREDGPKTIATTDWWSLKPLIRPVVPAGMKHPIDAFVEARLAKAGIKPLPEADRRTLLRRLCFDLHGLPPTPEAVAAFVADIDPMAYEKQVSRLLDSPRYGERWARHWLDTIHFADSHGCEHDVLRPNAWRFRDYVIDSLNRDTPWARFIREQLASDVFYPEQPELTPALGFIAAGPLELSRAGTAPVTFDYLDRDDMVTQTMAAFASTTANCARCHTHKFDPITQEDYYSLQAVFAGVGKGDVEYDTNPETANQRKRWEGLLAAADGKDSAVLLAEKHRAVVADWERRFTEHPASWEPLELESFQSSDGATLTREEDGSVSASGTLPDKDTYTISAKYPRKRLTAIRLDVLSDQRLPMNGPGRQDNGNLHLTEFEARLFRPGTNEPVKLKVRKATADWDQTGWTIAHALDGNLKTAWGIYPKVGASHQAVFELAQSHDWKTNASLNITLKQLHGGGHLIGRFQLFGTDVPPAEARTYPPAVLKTLKIPTTKRTDEQRLELAAHALRLHAQKQLASLPPRATVYAVSDRYSRAKKLKTPDAPKIVHVLKRGEFLQPGPVAQPGALAAITALPGRFDLSDSKHESDRRAALADWLASPDNPLTWRSIVNRVWQHHFGRGLCDTPNDFGRMGGEPSHPELLDWLAVWFRDDAKGSLKELHRLILTSQAWRRVSDLPPVRGRSASRGKELDAGNRLLWRMNRWRLDAESFRDSALQISGRLDLAMGGPGIEQFTKSKGQQSTPKLDYEAFDWNHASATRRSIYRVVWRGIADPFMESLDFPDLGLLPPKRGFSVSALQSLALYNNDFVLHASEWFAARLEREKASKEEQTRRAIELIFLRKATPDETRDLSEYVRGHGLPALCRVLLNSSEFLFVE